MPTQTVEDYLKQILVLQGDDGEAAVGDLARHLGVTPGTVTAMVKRLAAGKLVSARRYGGVRLTARGNKLAMNVLRRHRLLETFLVTTLGLDWSQVHAEAERLEHAVSDLLLDRIDEFLGRPSADPHGDPIPDAQGRFRTRTLVPLNTCTPGRKLRIARVLDQDPAFLRFIEDQGLKPGNQISLDRHDPNADALELTTTTKRVVISTRAAAKIMIEEP
jgi:DtxR family transcriptional regulator, Mn-dependent transcriptional regulator